MSPRLIVKRTAQAIALAITWPSALLAGFGRFEPAYTLFAQAYALGPGMPGNYLRSAFYYWTLRSCSVNTTIAFGTYFVHPGASLAPYASIGSYCVIGLAEIGTWAQIASHVEITSGRHQHARNEDGTLVGSIHSTVAIGAYSWIGASAIILASIGEHCTIGAGAVVVREIPDRSVAVGNPAKVIRTMNEVES